MIIRITRLAALVATMLFAVSASSQAGYQLVASAITATPANATLGGTTFTFTPSAGGTQTGATISNFNTIDVAVTSSTLAPNSDSGTITISQTLTFTPATVGASGPAGFGTEVFTLSGTLTLVAGNSTGIASTFSGTVTQVSGSGYTVSFAGYAPPSPGSSGTGGSTGNISILVQPNTVAVPEPASIAMLGLGLVSVGGLAFRRRMAK
jgi:hypothetical protein